jgi:3-hydroxyacyl-CoA dehydrogenase
MAGWVGVVGGGIMGSGIAEMSTRAGYEVLIREVDDEAAEAAAAAARQLPGPGRARREVHGGRT